MSIVANDDVAASRVVASGPVIHAAQVKEPLQAVESAQLRQRKSDAASSTMRAAAGPQSASLAGHIAVLSATATTLTPLPAAGPGAIDPHLAQPSRNVADGKTSAIAEFSNSGTTIAAANGDGAPNRIVALSAFTAVFAGQTVNGSIVKSQVGSSQPPAMLAERGVAEGVGAIEKGTATGPSPSLSAVAAISNSGASSDNFAPVLSRSAGVSGRVSVDTAVPGASSSGELNEAILQPEPAGSKGVSRTQRSGSIDFSKTGQSEVVSKPVQASEAGPLLQPHSLLGEASIGAVVSGAADSVGGGKPSGTLPDANGGTFAPPVVNATPLPAQRGTPLPASAGEPYPPAAEMPHAATAPFQELTATAKAGKAKRTGDADQSTASVPQALPIEAAITAAPNAAAPSLKDTLSGAAAIASGGIPMPVAHTAAEAIAGPVHAVGPTVPAGLNSIVGHTAGHLDGGLPSELPAGAQSGEPHRTLLATPTALEVGIQSGNQGWVKIRAEVGGQGEVKASLDAVSASGRDLLHRELPALNAFLHSEQMPVTASVVERSVAMNGGAAIGSSGLGGADRSGVMDGSSLQGGGGQREAGRYFSTGGGETVATYDSSGIGDAAAALSGVQAQTSTVSGRWLSVRV